METVTQILLQIEQGDPAATERLLPLVYDELRQLAAARLAHEKPGQTLQATALVHEAYLRLVDQDHVQRWDSRGHFFAAAAESIRRILIEQARRKRGPKAGGDRHRLELSAAELAEAELAERDFDPNLLDLDDALRQLEQHDPRAASVIKLRFFAGCTIEQTARALGVSAATAKNDWSYARSWLRARLVD